MNTYGEFLANKVACAPDAGIDGSFDLQPALFDFQRHCVEFALRKGRAALFLDTGLGKTICQLEWSSHVAAAVDAPALILAPLAVAWQIDREGKSFGYDCRVIRNMSGVGPGINICNYDRLDHLDPSAFGSVSLDESSILKSFDGKTTRALVAAFSNTRFRLCCTATPAPNDHMELGTHSEFLGILRPNEMLSRWFINDTSTASQSWRLKGHARDQFWQWVASWARMASTPEDLGYDGSAFDLPPMRIERHKVNAPVPKSAGLFGDAVSATGMFEIKRQSAVARVDRVAEIVSGEPGEPWVVWCDTDHESGMLTRAIGADAVEVKGSLPADEKERRLRMFADGERRVIVTKPKLAGFGLNWQHAARVAFVGRTFSYEAYYQAVRRCWRYGQSREVVVHLVIDDAEASIGAVVERKAEQHEEMKRAMATAMRGEVSTTGGRMTDYNPTHDADGIICLDHRRTPKSVIYHGDCVDVVRQMPDASVDFCVYSPPFGDLFVYSDSALDMGNSSSHGEFAEHYAFLVPHGRSIGSGECTFPKPASTGQHRMCSSVDGAD